MKLKFGFSTGSLHREFNTREALSYLKNLGVTVVELGLVKIDRLHAGWIDNLTAKELAGFDYVSLHSPIIQYGNNPETKFVFDKIKQVNNLRKLDLVIFHPDTIEDFSVFQNLEFPIGFENMDNKKITHKTVQDILPILTNTNWGLILDVNHIATNDPTMGLAREFYRKLGSQIKEIHLSGYQTGHEPLFQTQQKEILESIQNFDVPIIDEAVIDSKDVIKERDYVIGAIEQLILSREG